MKNDNKLLKSTFRDIIIKMFGWSIGFPLILIIIINIIDRLEFQWLYNISPKKYYLLKDFFYNFTNSSLLIIILAIIWLIGILNILYQFIKKYNSFIFSLSDSASKLFDKDVEYIELPKELEKFQIKLNHLKRENEKNERLAKENEQRKNDLIVYLAHDLKTPLTSTIGYLSLLDEIKDMPNLQRERYIKIALEKSYKLEDLINELFDIARFNSETIILEKDDLNLNMMLEQLVEEFYPILKENDKEINLNIDSKIIINGDSNKLARVFGNLIKNAIYYSTDKLITIDVSEDNEKVKLIFSNKGKKISEEKLKRIFEKFYRADSSRTTKTGGTGLGLAIAKEIIELHNGTIKATSDEEYTKFYVELPIKKS